jgi:hypothetical protein
MDTSGSRFLERFAGSGNFENRLNHSKRAPKDFRNAPGDFTNDGGNESFDYSVTSAAPANDNPDSRMGPGSIASQTQVDKQYEPRFAGSNSFKRQVQREKYLEDNNIAQGGGAVDGDSFVSKYSNANRQAQSGNSDGSSIANKYVNAAAQNSSIDIVALDKVIRSRPLYSGAKSELAGLLAYGDKYRNSRENPKEWAQPNPMEAFEKPDFESIYDKTREDIDSIDI